MRDDGHRLSLAKQFSLFARIAARDGAPIYQRICEGAGGDDLIVEILSHAPVDQQRPNLLLAAVHFLLLCGDDTPLADLYPTVAFWHEKGFDGESIDVFTSFREFCATHRTELIDVMQSRATQTNEVGRCAALYLAIALLGARHPGPISLLDLGTSAGLNLLLDHYSYTYTSASGSLLPAAGHPASPVRLQATLHADPLPDMTFPHISSRCGVDRRPVDPSDPEESLWLLACQWPDHLDRFCRTVKALELARTSSDPPRLVRGNLLDLVAPEVRNAPADSHVCIMHTWVAAYLSPAEQQALENIIRELSLERPLSWLFAESPYEVPGLSLPPRPEEDFIFGGSAKSATAVVLVEFENGHPHHRRLADMHPHGRWIEWWGDR